MHPSLGSSHTCDLLNYSIVWTIVWTISCIVIAIVETIVNNVYATYDLFTK